MRDLKYEELHPQRGKEHIIRGFKCEYTQMEERGTERYWHGKQMEGNLMCQRGGVGEGGGGKQEMSCRMMHIVSISIYTHKC